MITDTDTYVSTVAPLAADPAIQDAAAARLSQEIFTRTDIEGRTKNALPAQADFLAPVLTQGLENVVNGQIRAVIASDRFQRLWIEANRTSHQLTLKVLMGTGGAVSSREGRISINLGSVVADVRQRLDQAGVTAFDRVLSVDNNVELTLFQSPSLATAQRALRLLDRLAWLLPLATVIMLALALWLSPRRRRTLLAGGLGLAAGAALLLVATATIRADFLDSLTGTSVRPDAAAAVIDILTSSLKTAFRGTFVLGILVAAGAFMTGPARVAVLTRTKAVAFLRIATGKAASPAPLAAWISGHKTGLRVAGLIAALAVLVIADWPTPLYLLLTAAGLLIYLGLLELLGGRQREERRGPR